MKKIVLLVAAVACSHFALADWLLWQVCSSDYSGVSGITGVKRARVSVLDDDTLEPITEWGVKNRSSDGTVTQDAVLISPDSGYDEETYVTKIDVTLFESGSESFCIELLNSSGDVVGRTKTYQTYSQLSDCIASADIEEIPQAEVWHGGPFEAVPEPSSMALLALGAGLVGLRRKLRKGKKEKRA